MPRPRFQRLAPEKQKAILDAAMQEFSEHGFKNASFNRIIEKAGLSKGAMYYYFDDKKDLYLTVVRKVQREVLELMGAFPEVESAEEFWSALDQFFRNAGRVKLGRPDFIHLVLGLYKSMLAGDVTLPVTELFDESRSWAENLVVRGQGVGAVREDVQPGLLVALIFGALEAADLWLLQFVESMDEIDMEGAHRFSMGLFKRILEPGPDSEGRGWNILKDKDETEGGRS